MRRLGSALVATTIGALLLAGCGTDETPVPPPAKPSAAPPVTPADCTNDEATLKSYDPDHAWGGDGLDEIRSRKNPDGSVGRLIVGVSADTYLMAAQSGDGLQLRGFDIDIAKAIAEEIFGSGDDLGKHIQWKVITAADRIQDLQDGTVDMVVRNMTITCDRWEQVAFSAEYYHATQKMLFRQDVLDRRQFEGGYHDVSQLSGLRICAPLGSTSLTNITSKVHDVTVDAAPNHTGCLVKLQKEEVDAITGDDTVLAGLAAQDPYAVVPDDQPALEPSYGEPYGVAVSKDNPALAAFVNKVLADMNRTGEWQHLYHRWLEPYLKVAAAQPSPLYGRTA